jgi:hypothetical protein
MRLGFLRTSLLFCLGALLVLTAAGSVSYSQAEKKDQPKGKKAAAPPVKKEVAKPAPPEALLRHDAWEGVPTTPLQPGEFDRLLDKEFAAGKLVPAPPAADEQFLRRVRLDLTGQLPAAAEVEQFLADESPDKRAKLIDRLLETDEYARHWARYWRDAVTAVEAPFGAAHVPAFEDWLTEQFKQNRNWGEVVRAMLTAEGSLKKDDPDRAKHGAVFFLGRFSDADGNIQRTAETSRLFLGIQIQCAQCHADRRTKIWHQVQFHELAGFFARMGVTGSNGSLIRLTVKPNGEHLMPGKEPNTQFVTYPRFLDGRAPPGNASDADRRKALADFVTSPDNYWFSATFANRMCAELLGQSFYERVDDLSPKAEVVFPPVITRLAAAFKGSGYDVKGLLRAVANSRAYQRQVRLGGAVNAHLLFAAVYPNRLRADVLWDALSRVLVKMPGLETPGTNVFRSEFGFDPSVKPDEVAGSIGQALWLLNSQVVNDRVKVGDVRPPPPPKKDANPKGPPAAPVPEPTLLKQLVAKHGADDAAVIRDLYLHVLARKPTDRELQINVRYVKETTAAATRNEALEDVFKVLINSTEFQRRR